jgi:hypothetical protein
MLGRRTFLEVLAGIPGIPFRGRKRKEKNRRFDFPASEHCACEPLLGDVSDGDLIEVCVRSDLGFARARAIGVPEIRGFQDPLEVYESVAVAGKGPDPNKPFVFLWDFRKSGRSSRVDGAHAGLDLDESFRRRIRIGRSAVGDLIAKGVVPGIRRWFRVEEVWRPKIPLRWWFTFSEAESLPYLPDVRLGLSGWTAIGNCCHHPFLSRSGYSKKENGKPILLSDVQISGIVRHHLSPVPRPWFGGLRG